MNNEERNRLLQLQRNFENHQIDEKDISQEDMEKLDDLYDEQIKILKEKIAYNESNIQKIKKRIMNIRNKLE